MAYPGGGGSFSTGSSGGESTSSGGEARTRTVSLCRRPGSKLGFSIRGGKEHGTGFFITAVETHSEAAKQGLKVGDQIIRINGFPVEDATHKEVLQLIVGQNTVNFKVKSVGMIPVKESPEDELSWQIVDPPLFTSHQPELYSGDVCEESSSRTTSDVRMVLRVPPRAKLGCGICKGPEWKPGVFVQFTKESSIAREAGLRPGDQILQCNNFIFTPETPFVQAVSVMRCSGVLELVVRKGAGLELFPGESSGYNSSASSVAGDNPPRISALTEPSHGSSNGAIAGSERKSEEGMKTGRLDYPNGCTVIHVGGDETENKKIAEICMVSQQLETKTTTVFVEVHHSEADSVSNTQSEASTDRFTNTSSVSSFTSSASSLSSAISQELERRSKRLEGNGTPVKNQQKQTDKLIKNGLAKEKVEQHEQLMMEFKKAHRKMFSSDSDSTIKEEREEKRLTEEKSGAAPERKSDTAPKDAEKPKPKRQSLPPPPPPFPDENGKRTEKAKGGSVKKYAAPPPPPPPSPPYCPTPDYDTVSLASEQGKQRADNVEMQSIESFRLTNPTSVKHKPPSTYFQNGSENSNEFSSCSTSSTMKVRDTTKPLVTIREYPVGRERKAPGRFDFLQNPTPPSHPEEPITSRLQNELSQTLSRAGALTNNNNESRNESPCTSPNGSQSKGTVVTISVTPQGSEDASKPFYLFPNGNSLNGMDNKKLNTLITSAASKNALVNGNIKPNSLEVPQKNSVTFNLSNRTQEVRNGCTQKNGILKNGNSNISQVQIQSQIGIDKMSSQKSIKFGGM